MILKSIEYIGKFLLVDKINKFPLYNPLTVLVGNNGCGKTTTLDIIHQLLLGNNLEKELSKKVNDVRLITDKGLIEYTEGKIITEFEDNEFTVIKMDQIIHNYDLTEEDKFTIVNDKFIIEQIDNICDDRDDLMIDLVNCELYFKNKYTGSTYDYNDAPESIRRYIQMLLFAKRTKEGDILLIDGAEDHLHLCIQRDLVKNLMKLCKGQLIITTHSPVILSDGIADKTICIPRYYENKNTGH